MNDVSGREPFSRFSGKFSKDVPAVANGYRVYSGAWKFGFDELPEDEIVRIVERDPRPLWCAETFPKFKSMHVVELGPADGYNTMGLERLGAESVTAIEGNVDAFLRCLILKNAFGLRATFILGDFTNLFDSTLRAHDLLYASGVLYHLKDPLSFLEAASRYSRNLFLWTHFYDLDCVQLIANERDCFGSGLIEEVDFHGHSISYYKRIYNTQHVSAAGYIGGLEERASWMSREDLFKALDLCGYRIKKIVEDPYAPGRMPAVNILASQD